MISPAMEISGGQGANGPHLFGLAPNFLEMGATVAPIFWPQQASKFGLPAKYTKNFARASGARTCHPPIFLTNASKNCKILKFLLRKRDQNHKLGPQLLIVAPNFSELGATLALNFLVLISNAASIPIVTFPIATPEQHGNTGATRQHQSSATAPVHHRNVSKLISKAEQGILRPNCAMTSGWSTPMVPTQRPPTSTSAQRPAKYVASATAHRRAQ